MEKGSGELARKLKETGGDNLRQKEQLKSELAYKQYCMFIDFCPLRTSLKDGWAERHDYKVDFT